jgi:predicted dehydrogenase
VKQPVKHQIAIAGFRHGHAVSLLQKAQSHPRLAVVALCEENFEASLMPSHSLLPDYTSFQTMLEEVPCDIVGLGDIFSKRGEQAILALQKGRHVISDKPLCTSLEQLEIIAAIASQKKLSVAVMLGLRPGD